MSLIGYSKCTIRFIPKDRQGQGRQYSERSLIELRQQDFNDYSIRAVDIDNNKTEIFKIPLKERDLYSFASSPNAWDELRSDDGTYRLFLNADARDGFHKDLRGVLDNLIPQREGSLDDNPKHAETYSSGRSSQRTTSRNRNGILVDIHRLNEHIAQGDADKAAKLVTQLTSQGVSFQAKISTRLPNEKMFPVRIRVNGREEQVVLNVYESTTIRELQVNFEHTHKFPLSNQYFFIDGYLVDENASMNDLNIYPDSLFVLFIIQQ